MARDSSIEQCECAARPEFELKLFLEKRKHRRHPRRTKRKILRIVSSMLEEQADGGMVHVRTNARTIPNAHPTSSHPTYSPPALRHIHACLELDVILVFPVEALPRKANIIFLEIAFTVAHAAPLPDTASYPIQLITPEEDWTSADVDVAYVAEEPLIVGPMKVCVALVCPQLDALTCERALGRTRKSDVDSRTIVWNECEFRL